LFLRVVGRQNVRDCWKWMTARESRMPKFQTNCCLVVTRETVFSDIPRFVIINGMLSGTARLVGYQLPSRRELIDWFSTTIDF
jgi:hypothetical protein